MHKSTIGSVLALALCLASSAVAAQTPSASLHPKVAAQLQKAETQEQSGNLKAAHDTLAGVTRMKEFAAMPPARRGEIWAVDAKVAAQLGLTGYAAISARTGSKLPGQEGLVAVIALMDAFRAADDNAQRKALKTLATQYPDTLASLPDRAILVALLAPAPDAAAEAEQGEIAEALLAHWKPQDPFQTLDGARLIAAQQRLATGRRDEARQLAVMMEAQSAMLIMRTDRRFDGLFGSDGWALPTPRAASEAYLARVRTLRGEHPRRLTGPSTEASVLLSLRAGDEALQVIEAALAEAERNPRAFSDTRDVLSRIKEQHAIILDRLRRYDESKAVFRQGAALSEGGNPNVSQMLDLSTRLIDDDPGESIRLTKIALGRGISDYGEGVGLRTQVCAYLALNQPQEAQAAYNQLLAMKEPGVDSLVEDAALCMKDDDRVAASLIANLKTSARRRQAISRMQVTMPIAYPPRSPRLEAQAARFRAVVLRPDVQAALEPYGRLITLKPDELWLR